MDVSKKILFKQIGAKIAYYRTLRSMSQTELAKRANISRSVLSRIERGKYNDNVSVSVLFNIAEGLRIEAALLLTFNEVEKGMWWQEVSFEDDDEPYDEGDVEEDGEEGEEAESLRHDEYGDSRMPDLREFRDEDAMR